VSLQQAGDISRIKRPPAVCRMHMETQLHHNILFVLCQLLAGLLKCKETQICKPSVPGEGWVALAVRSPTVSWNEKVVLTAEASVAVMV